MTKGEAQAFLTRHSDRVTNLLEAASDLSARKVDPATRGWVSAILACTEQPVTRPGSLR